MVRVWLYQLHYMIAGIASAVGLLMGNRLIAALGRTQQVIAGSRQRSPYLDRAALVVAVADEVNVL